MKCPNDQATLLISERKNIEIDYCPECRGVWLDRGELDKLLGSNEATQQHPGADHRIGQQSVHSQPKKKKRESFLEDLFDF